MSYQIRQLASDLVHITMSGHVDKDTAEVYHPEAWQLLDACPRPTNIIMDARDVQSVCPKARKIVDQIQDHPNVGTIAFVVRHRYLLLFSPVVQFFSGLRMFGSEDEAMTFFQAQVAVPTGTHPTTTSTVTVTVAQTTSADRADNIAVPVVNMQSITQSKSKNPVTGVVSFFSDMFKGMTCRIEDKPGMLE